MVFAMECTLLYKNVRVILVHDVESCFFPGEDQQPENVRSLFQEKAITYLAGNPLKVLVIYNSGRLCGLRCNSNYTKSQ
jgi:hypothetical protein